MTKEQLQDRLNLINDQINQAMANLNMLLGGKQECLYWISQLENKEVSHGDITVIST